MISFYIICCIFLFIFVSSFALNDPNRRRPEVQNKNIADGEYNYPYKQDAENPVVQFDNPNRQNAKISSGASNYNNRQNANNAIGQHMYPNLQNAEIPPGAFDYQNPQNANNPAQQYKYSNRQNAKIDPGASNYHNRQNANNVAGANNNPNRQNAFNAAGAYNNPIRQNPYNAAGAYNNPNRQNAYNAAGAYNDPNRQNAYNTAGAYNNPNRQNAYNAAGAYNNPNRQNAYNAAGAYNNPNRQNPYNAAGAYNNPNRQNLYDAAGTYNNPNRQNAYNADGAYNNPNRQNAYNADGSYNNPNRQNAYNADGAYNKPNRQNDNIAAGVKMQNEGSDIPKKTDLEKYVFALDKLLKFYIRAANDVDVNIVFGFFLTKVNLISALKNKQSPDGNITGLPVTLSSKLRNVTRMNEIIVRYFRMMAAQSEDPMRSDKQLKRIATLFSNETLWASLMKTADNKEVVDPPELSYNDIVNRYASWPEYKSQIENMQRIMPSFDVTEKCIIILAENRVYHGNFTWQQCVLPQDCYAGISEGNDLGFGMTNRLMLLIQARFARRCSIFSKGEDTELLQNLCSAGFYEASFISMNKFDTLILMLEQITLCSLNGNVEFLRRPWLDYILELQSPYGCFSNQLISKSKRRSMPPMKPSQQWRLDRSKDRKTGQSCDGNTSAAAAAILSAAIKYIMDLYY